MTDGTMGLLRFMIFIGNFSNHFSNENLLLLFFSHFSFDSFSCTKTSIHCEKSSRLANYIQRIWMTNNNKRQQHHQTMQYPVHTVCTVCVQCSMPEVYTTNNWTDIYSKQLKLIHHFVVVFTDLMTKIVSHQPSSVT